jgi:DNA-binding transcriptional regulator YiaG
MKRNIGQELLDGIEAIKGGGVHHAVERREDVKTVRGKTGLSQSTFATILGVRGVRTFQEWGLERH